MPRLLSGSEIRTGLKSLKGWRQEGTSITKSFVFKEFMDGIDFMRVVAEVAEEQEHHPDIHVRYTTVTLSLQTHSEGGVTKWDLGLAESIEKALERVGRA